ncbi:hypothetical protein NR798_47580 [Archangium gephyra]|uniref:hypothetical protein n=1 Tax=Archangium gephyra TaxID=48 RepID=UPI0035D46F2A
MKKLAAGGLFLAATAFGSAAWAGYKSSGQVTINSNTNEAWGSMGYARNSADNTQYIGCSLEWTAGGGVINGRCKARTAAGKELECLIHNANDWVLGTLGTITSDSAIRFRRKIAGTECDVLTVENYSWDQPK